MQIYQKTKAILHLASKSYSHLQQKLLEHRELVLTYTYSAISLFVIALCLLALVKVRTESYWLGYQIAECEREKIELLDRMSWLSAELAKNTNRESLLRRNQEFNLQLLPPEQWIPIEKK